jgi:PadR family transcriptional regulator PadR
MRKTRQALDVIAEFMENPSERHWGYELAKRTGLRSGVLYPILRRMLDEGWLDDGWEDPAEIEASRPPRRYYLLTAAGQAEFGAMLRAERHDVRAETLAEGFA